MKHDHAPPPSLFFEDQHLESHSVFLKKAFFVSFALHLGLLALLLSQSLFSSSRVRPQPKAILVQTVHLSPKTASLAMKPPEKPKTSPPAPRDEPTPPRPPETPPQPQEPAPEPTPQEPLQKEIEERVQKESSQEALPTAPQEKKEEVVKPSAKREKKTEPLVVKKKEKKSPPPSPSKAKTEKAKPQKEKSNAVSREVAKNVESLLAQAKRQRKGMADTKSGHQKGSSSPLVGPLSDLSFEGKDSTEESGQDFETTPEEAYISNLIRLIQISVSLPDKEPVSLQLELFSSGLLKSLRIVSCSSSRNKKAVEKGLSSLRYPAFLRAYKGEKNHCFSFKFTREMEWISAYP